MPTVQRYLKDQYGRPIAAATVTIKNAVTGLLAVPLDGAANPAVTDSLGFWQMSLTAGEYAYVAKKGDDFISGTVVAAASLIAGSDYSIYLIEIEWDVFYATTYTFVKD